MLGVQPVYVNISLSIFINMTCDFYRTLMNRAFADDGVFHFTSPSMIDRTRRGSNASIEPEDLRISSVIVDEQKGKLEYYKSCK